MGGCVAAVGAWPAIIGGDFGLATTAFGSGGMGLRAAAGGLAHQFGLGAAFFGAAGFGGAAGLGTKLLCGAASFGAAATFVDEVEDEVFFSLGGGGPHVSVTEPRNLDGMPALRLPTVGL